MTTPFEPANGPHEHLRAATRDHHDMAEAAFARFDLRDPAGYRGFLLAQAGAVLGLEQLAEAAGLPALLPDWDGRRRGPAILRDLDGLGLVAPQVELGPQPGIDPLGLAYVLEGARHGGRILFKRVLAGSDPRSRAATAYLGQPFDPRQWADVLAVLRQRRADPHSWDGLTNSAIFAFDLFRMWADHSTLPGQRSALGSTNPSPPGKD